MKILVDTKDRTKGILIAETDEEYRVCKYLMPITWGFYFLKNCKAKTTTKEDEPLILALMKKFPNATGIGKLSSPQGFVEEDIIKEEAEQKKAMKEKMDKEEKEKELFSHLLKES